jgi:hypothetical protein
LPQTVVLGRGDAIIAGSQPCPPDDGTLNHASKRDELWLAER